jgi:hypothetical protein
MKYFDYLIPCLIGFVIILLVAALVITPSYADGYCTALGGDKISSDWCNVNGRAVEIR